MTFSHVAIPVADIAASKQFYTTLLEPLGYKLLVDFDVAVGFGKGDKADFWLGRTKDGKKLPDDYPKVHFAFQASSKEDVQTFYETGLKAGAVDNGAPGERPRYGPGYYACFLYDLDGYNIEAQLIV